MKKKIKKYQFSIRTDTENSKLTITITYGQNSVKVIFLKAIAKHIGVDRNFFDKPVANEKYIFRYGVDLNTKIHHVTIYYDLAIYTLIGDVTAPILRVLLFESKGENNHLHQEFVNVHYIPVAKSFIYQVLTMMDEPQARANHNG